MRMGGGSIDIISYDKQNNVYLNDKLVTGVFYQNIKGSASTVYENAFYSKELYFYIINKLHNKTIGVVGFKMRFGQEDAIIYIDLIYAINNSIELNFNILNSDTTTNKAVIYNVDNPNDIINE